MSCDLLSSPLSLHRPRYPKIVYHNDKWTPYPDIPPPCRTQAAGHQTQTPFPFSGDGPSFASSQRRHTLEHINCLEEDNSMGNGCSLRESRKRPKISRRSNSFKRKSLLFFRMLGATDKKDKLEEENTSKMIECTRDTTSSPLHTSITSLPPHQSVRSVASEPASTGKDSSSHPDDVIVHRTVSDTTDHVVLRRSRTAATDTSNNMPSTGTTPPDINPSRGGRPTDSVTGSSSSRPSTMMDLARTPSSSSSSSSRNSSSISPIKRPSSCYVPTSSQPPETSRLQRKLRRLSASVRNFSFDKLLNTTRKLSGPLKEVEADGGDKEDGGGCCSQGDADEISNGQRKSLPPDFKFENAVSHSTPSIFRKARSIQDPETPDPNGPDRLNRSSSLEMVDNLSSIRRTHSEKEKHETESSEHSSLSSKAKSITEQLERIKYNLNTSDGIPPLEYQNWTELLPESVIQSLGKKEEDQQHHIWELVTTEHNYITTLSTIINTLLGCLRHLHNENYLTKINEKDVFLNIEDIRRIHLIFWKECVVPLIQTTKDTAEPLNPEIFTRASTLFEEELNPLFEYCINYHESRSYIKQQQHKNNDFKEYINWCNNQIRQQHNKLGIDDMLIKPIQRIQKYPIIIRDILKKTTDDDTKCVLNIFHEKVRVFVESLNRRKEEKEESQKVDAIKERIESYSVLPTSNSSQTNDQINQILNKYNNFDLADKVPLLNTQRKFLHENLCKMSPTIDAKAQDITLFLFSDHILITRTNKNPKKKNKIIKQPLTLDRVVMEDMKDLSHTNLVVYLNEYGSLVDMFLLQSSNQEAHTTLFNAVIQAKDHYTREKNKLYTELDASKSVSTTSVNSSGGNPYLTTSTALFRPPACTITRSSSEHYPPARRVTPDAASSVSRAQSMPASNERRNLAPPAPSIASSSSSSASSSSSSVSEAPSSSDKTTGTLSDIKESDKFTESGTEDVPPDHNDDDVITMEQRNDIIPSVVKSNESDVYISDNLSTEFSNNVDLNKGISDSVNFNNADSYSNNDSAHLQNDKLLFSKTDALYIDHHQQSES